MINPLIPAVYAARNVDKSLNKGDIGRYLVIPGQIKNSCLAACALNIPVLMDNNFIKKEITGLKSNSNFFKRIDKFIDFSAKNTNLLLSLSAILRVFGAENRKEATFKETSAMTCMFLGENIMKKIRRKIGLLNNIKSASPLKKLIHLGLDSILQVGTSILSYNFGAKLGLKLSSMHDEIQKQTQQRPIGFLYF